jgi:hypothetical protein
MNESSGFGVQAVAADLPVGRWSAVRVAQVLLGLRGSITCRTHRSEQPCMKNLEGLILLLVLVGLFLTSVALFHWQRKEKRRPPYLSCGQCGYPTVGLPTAVCPECGSDLSTVGTVRGTSRLPGPVIAALCYWASVVFTLMTLELPPVTSALSSSRLALTYHLHGPQSGAYAGIDTYVSCTEADNRLTLHTVTVRLLLLSGAAPEFELDIGHQRYRYRGVTGPWVQGGEPLGLKAIVSWMRLSGIDTENGSVQVEAESISESLTGMFSDDSKVAFRSDGFGVVSLTRASRVPLLPRWTPFCILISWFVVAVVIWRLLIRKRATGMPGRAAER